MTQPSPDWRALRLAWRKGKPGIAQIAAAHGVAPEALRERARLEGWGPRRKRAAAPAVAAPPVLLSRARTLYHALDEALKASLQELRRSEASSDEEEPRGARARSELIKAHLKALQALYEAEKSLASTSEPPPETPFPAPAALDLDAAWAEFMDRIARLHAAR